MGIWDWMILAVLAVWLFAAIFLLNRRKKQGGCIGCGRTCFGCTGRSDKEAKCKKHPVSRL